MKTIRVSDEVWAAMALRGKFGETADDVLRRVLLPSVQTRNSTEDNGRSTEFSVPPSTARPRGWKERQADVALRQRQDGNMLVFSFANGVERSFQLPAKENKQAIRRLRDDAVAWARQNGATQGQQAAVMRALTSRGYHITK